MSKKSHLIQVIIASSLIVSAMTDKSLGAEKYHEPVIDLKHIAMATPTPSVSLSPDKKMMLLLELPSLPDLKDFATPIKKLGGLRFNPVTNGFSRELSIIGLKLKEIKSGKEFNISGFPKEIRANYFTWSPDSKKISFMMTTNTKSELWVIDVLTYKAEKINDFNLNPIIDKPYQWFSDSKHILVNIVPPKRKTLKFEEKVPESPIIQESTGEKTPVRTYQDMLSSPEDEFIFDYYANSDLGVLDLSNRKYTKITSGIFRNFAPSPDGHYLLIEKIHKPYSYVVPFYRFPYTVEILNNKGKLIKKLADNPLAEKIPLTFDSVAPGPRNFEWRSDKGSEIMWVEARDGGDASRETLQRDKLFLLSSPFHENPKELFTTSYRFENIDWGKNDFAIIKESWWKSREEKVWKINPDKPEDKAELIYERSSEDRYTDPGSIVKETSSMGTSLIKFDKDKKNYFRIGEGASPEGNIPFLSKISIKNHKSEKIWESKAPHYELPQSILSDDANKIFTRIESVKEPPNYFIRDLKDHKITRITHFENPIPAITNAKKQIITYKREDGVNLSGKLYLPEDYDPKKGTLPVLLWAYPREFKSAASAGQIKGSPYEFTRINWGSPLFFLVRGFAVLDGPDMPIIGEGNQEPNDTYIKQLVSSAEAAVNELVKMGISDGKRIAVGGHSYGAFMTANLLAHSNLFCAGIARSGAYNRTLTPFGFQAEERTYWQAPEVYYKMSPFNHADKIKAPLLLIHGADDNNSGTFPMQSERMFSAIKGLGGKTRLVMLPFESHHYRSKESVLHMLWEMDNWLEKYVKNCHSEEK